MKVLHFLMRPPGLCETFLTRSFGSLPDAEENLLILQDEPRGFLRVPSIPTVVSGPLGPLFPHLLPLGRPQVIVAHFLTHALLALPLKLRYRVPLVAVAYGHDLSSFPLKGYGLGATVLKLLARYVDALWVLTPYQKQLAMRLGFPERKISLMHPGLKGPGELPVEVKKIRRILMASSLRAKKNHAFALQVLSCLPEDCVLRIAGEGDEEEFLKNEIHRLGLLNRVEFSGPFLSLKELTEHFLWADALLHPSTRGPNGDEEGLPLLMLEAMQAGLPVLSIPGFGLEEFLKDSVWFGPDFPRLFAEELQKRSIPEWKQQVETARLRVQDYAMDKCASQRRAALEKLI